jgi:hypothetical protein
VCAPRKWLHAHGAAEHLAKQGCTNVAVCAGGKQDRSEAVLKLEK